MKRKVITICIMTLIVSFTFAENPDENAIKKFIRLGAFEPINESFKDKKDSIIYINKYNLKNQEIAIVGNWVVDFLSRNETKNFGAGICVNFLPNRTLLVFQNNYPDNNQYLVGTWKLIENKIYVIIFSKVIEKNFSYEYQKYENAYWFILYDSFVYKIAYVNNKSFYWNNMDLNYRKFFNIDPFDQPRFRSLTAETPMPFDYMYANSPLGKIMLNGNMQDMSDVIKLCKEFALAPSM